jgi:hypothetical protein
VEKYFSSYKLPSLEQNGTDASAHANPMGGGSFVSQICGIFLVLIGDAAPSKDNTDPSHNIICLFALEASTIKHQAL